MIFELAEILRRGELVEGMQRASGKEGGRAFATVECREGEVGNSCVYRVSLFLFYQKRRCVAWLILKEVGSA